MNYMWWKLTLGVIATFGLYSLLYRETRFYRFFEHLFLGLAAGYGMAIMWTDTLYPQWWLPMVGATAEGTSKAQNGYWLWALMLPLGLMAYLVYHEKHGWMARIPIGALLGLWGGQQVQIWWNRYGDPITTSIRPVFPTTLNPPFVPNTQGMSPGQAADVGQQVYLSQAVNNLIFIAVLLCVLTYFIFSIDFKSKLPMTMAKTGRWAMMVGFGAIFGSTVMTRFALLIDRMYFVWIEWFKGQILHM